MIDLLQHAPRRARAHAHVGRRGTGGLAGQLVAVLADVAVEELLAVAVRDEGEDVVFLRVQVGDFVGGGGGAGVEFGL